MARLLRASRSAARICSLTPKFHSHSFSLLSQKTISTSSELSPENLPSSPLVANIVRILQNEIDYHSELAPPREHCTDFNSFKLVDRPGEQWITMRRKFGDNEDIKIEATMFDGYAFTPSQGDDSDDDDTRLHISLIVDISKGNGSEDLEFVCSAWPDCIEVESVYILRRDRLLGSVPYTGRDIRKLGGNFQKGFIEYLQARGIDDELSAFLHDFMVNKDRVELIRWFKKVKSNIHK